MACKWYNEDFAYTAEDVRNVYPEDGGWWYSSEVTNSLNLRLVPYTTFEYEDADQIVYLLKDGNIMIVCLNAGKITDDPPTALTGVQ